MPTLGDKASANVLQIRSRPVFVFWGAFLVLVATLTRDAVPYLTCRRLRSPCTHPGQAPGVTPFPVGRERVDEREAKPTRPPRPDGHRPLGCRRKPGFVGGIVAVSLFAGDPQTSAPAPSPTPARLSAPAPESPKIPDPS